jgi:hypothetical protein
LGQVRSDRAWLEAYLEFREQLRDTLASGDVRAFRAFLRDEGRSLGDRELEAMGRWSDEALRPLMYRMVIADPHLKAHHAEARAWLRERHIPLRVKSVGYGWSTELRHRYQRLGDQSPGRRTA